jgi:hypothetical protein
MNCIVCNNPLAVGKLFKPIDGEQDLQEVIIFDTHPQCQKKTHYEKYKYCIYNWREKNRDKLNENHKKYSNDYYHRNREVQKQKALDRYYKKKLEKELSESSEQNIKSESSETGI